MSDKIIYIPFAFEKDRRSGVNIKYTERDIVDLYLKNASVALLSAKKYNADIDVDVALVTNLSIDEIPETFRKLYKKYQIEIFTIPYNYFRFDKDYLWSLAFYKLCALKYVVELKYKYIAYMDTDVYVQGDFSAIWQECVYNIMLYDINHGLNTKNYRILCDETTGYFGEKKYITHYGGEFFAANSNNACNFIVEAEKIYNKMIAQKINTTRGDEFIISLCADTMREKIKNAGAYIYRFWTDCSFRLVSTCYKYNRITILHVPSEKTKGMIKLYNKYISKGLIPNDRKVWKILHLYFPSFITIIKSKIKDLLN